MKTSQSVIKYFASELFDHIWAGNEGLKIRLFDTRRRSLTLKDTFISESCIEIKIELNFYFHTSLWCLKRFYEGLKGLNFFTLSGIGTLRVKEGFGRF